MLRFAALSLLAILVAGAPSPQDGHNNVYSNSAEAAKFNSHLQPPVPYVSLYQSMSTNVPKFYLFTTKMPRPVELNHHISSIETSSYNIKYETVVLIPDANYKPHYLLEMVSAYLRQEHEKADYINVIVTDYYSDSSNNVHAIPETVGKPLAAVLKMINEYGTPYMKMHLIGHGVGAHVAGAVAKYIYPGKFDRITGLEPLGGDFDKDEALLQLRRDSALFVDTVTARPTFSGSVKERGHVNFDAKENPEVTPGPERSMQVFNYYLEALMYPKNFPCAMGSTTLYMGEYISRSPRNEAGICNLEVNPKIPYGTFPEGGQNEGNNQHHKRASMSIGEW